MHKVIALVVCILLSCANVGHAQSTVKTGASCTTASRPLGATPDNGPACCLNDCLTGALFAETDCYASCTSSFPGGLAACRAACRAEEVSDARACSSQCSDQACAYVAPPVTSSAPTTTSDEADAATTHAETLRDSSALTNAVVSRIVAQLKANRPNKPAGDDGEIQACYNECARGATLCSNDCYRLWPPTMYNLLFNPGEPGSCLDSCQWEQQDCDYDCDRDL